MHLVAIQSIVDLFIRGIYYIVTNGIDRMTPGTVTQSLSAI